MAREPLTDWDNTKVNGLIAAGDHDAATSRIDAALEQVPGFLQARLARVRLLLSVGNPEDAATLSSVLADEVADNPWVWLLAVQAHAAAADAETAKAIFNDGSARLTLGDNLLTAALNDLLPALGGTEDQIAFLLEALKVVPDNRMLMLRLLTRAQMAGDVKLALDMLLRAESLGPLPDFAKRIQTQLLPHVVSMEAAADQLALNVQAGADDAETLCRLCRYAAAVGRFEQSQAALMRALELHPIEWRPLYRLNRVFLPARQDTAIFASLDKLRAEANVSNNWLLQFSFFALRLGETTIATDILERLTDDPVIRSTARDVLSALKATGEPGPRTGVTDDADVRVVRKEDAQGTLVVFGNFLGGISFIPDRYLDSLLADLPANVIYMRDPYGRVYLNGIPQLGPGEPATQQALRKLIGELGGGKVITLGNSASGYAALRSGLEIEADHVISLAGLLTPGKSEDEDPVHIRMGMEELFGKDPDAMDLRLTLAEKTATNLTLVVGGQYAPDMVRSRAAKNLGNATVHVMPDVASHHCALSAIADGTLMRLLNATFETKA